MLVFAPWYIGPPMKRLKDGRCLDGKRLDSFENLVTRPKPALLSRLMLAVSWILNRGSQPEHLLCDLSRISSKKAGFLGWQSCHKKRSWKLYFLYNLASGVKKKHHFFWSHFIRAVTSPPRFPVGVEVGMDSTSWRGVARFLKDYVSRNITLVICGKYNLPHCQFSSPHSARCDHKQDT